MSKKMNRNSPCHCGSGKKYKNCCIHKDSQPAKHTADGKFKFSAEVLSKEQQAEYSSVFAQLASSVAESSSRPTLASQKLQYQITKNKGGLGKKTIRNLKAKEERETNKKLQQHSFSFMNLDTGTISAVENKEEDQSSADDIQKFIPTTEDYRKSEEEKSTENNIEK